MRSRTMTGLAALATLLAVVAAVPVDAASAVASEPHASTALAVIQRAGAVPNSAIELGALPGSKRLSMRVVLEPRSQAALTSFIDGVSSPTSPMYRDYLRKGQFAARFGPTAAAIAAVRASLTHGGLTVTSISPSHLVLSVSGTAAAFDATLHTSIDRWRLATGVVGYQTATSVELPSSAARFVAGIAGTSSLAQPRAVVIRGRAVLPHLQRHALAVTSRDGPSSGCTDAQEFAGYSYLPQQEGDAYGLTAAWNVGDDGTSHTIAVVELASYSMADIVYYDQCFGIIGSNASSDPNVRNIDIDGGAGPFNVQNAAEPTLDIEEIRSLAPGADVDVYLGPNGLPFGIIDTYQQIATDDTAQIVSTSWGECEQFSDHAEETPIFEQMAAQGQTVFAAAGDDGSSDCIAQSPVNGPLLVSPAVDDPASQPDVTGVGGLTVTSISPLSESVWNDCGGASGGGISSVYARPSWQQAPGVPTGSARGVHSRLVPDLSVIGDPCDGMLVYIPGQVSGEPWQPYGGTSMGAPLMAAITAVAAQRCDAPTLGFLNPRLYAMGRAGAYFNAVTTGSNAIAPSTATAGEYNADDADYNLAAGLGSPNPATFIDGLCSAPATATAAPSTPRAAAAAWTVSFTTGSTSYSPGTTVSITAPAGTALPSLTSDWTVTPTGGGAVAPSAVVVEKGAGSSTSNVARLTLADAIGAFTGVGITAAAVTNPAISGTATVSIADSLDALVEDAPLTLAGGGPDAATSRVTATVGSAALGSAGADVAAVVHDATGNAVAGATVTAHATGGASTFAVVRSTSTAGGATVVVRSDAVGTSTVTVDVDGTPVGHATVRFTDPFAASRAVVSLGGIDVLGTPGATDGDAGASSYVVLARVSGGGIVVGVSAKHRIAAARIDVGSSVAASSPSIVRVGTRLFGAYRSTLDHLVVLTQAGGSHLAGWRVTDLTALGEAPLVTGDPSVVIAGTGAAQRVSIASVATTHAVLRTTALVRTPTRFATLDVSRAANVAADAAGDVAQVSVGATVGLFARIAGGQLVMYTPDGGAWLADNLATDAELSTAGGDSIAGNPSVVPSVFGATVAVTTTNHLLDVFTGSLGNWSATTLVRGAAGTSPPAGQVGLPPLVGTPVIVMHGTEIDVFDSTVFGRLEMLASYGVADPWASFDVTALARVPAGATLGVTQLPATGTSLLGEFGTRLEVVTGGAV